MSKKEKIKKYLKEHGDDIVVTIAGGLAGVVVALYGYNVGAKTACIDFANALTAVSKERGVDVEYKVIGNAIRGFDIIPKA